MELITHPTPIEPFDLYLFGRGEHWDIYRILGAHPHEQEGLAGYRFAVWAPSAKEVHLVCESNDWRWGELPLFPVGVSGIWAAFVPGMPKGVLYKYGILQTSDRIIYKTDPYGQCTELRPGVACKTWTLEGYAWQDDAWMQRRQEAGLLLDKPMSVYEVHAGSWRKHENAPGRGFYSYRELADTLVPYVKEMGFTHIQFMPLAEHPLDESWGYQTSHHYAPTSRFGEPDDLRHLIDRCHQEGIGVLLDWVPGHFPKDEWCLGRFDGEACYEHADPRQGEHPDWGTYIFNYGRHEVRNFLLANALYWLKEFHIDGIRIDAVASMLYLDYSRKDGEWIPNIYGGNENLEAIDFLKELNRVVHEQFPGVITVAEESTAWPGVSRPLYTGGLGFTFKWNMGWMHDTLLYFSKESVHRQFHHNNLTFSMLYAFSENFVLPLSHDEVVHGKKALLAKMPGDMWQQFANARAMLSYVYAHPGKKLLFMGSEIGQWNEWDAGKELDWMLLEYPTHQGLQRTVKELNRMHCEEPAMHRHDHDWGGFEWVDLSDYTSSVLSFLRKAPCTWQNEKQCAAGRPLLWVFNFTPVVRTNYAIGCPYPGVWKELFNSDSHYYGGSNVGNDGGVMAHKADLGTWPYYLELTLPPLAAMAFAPERWQPQE
ncbi:1,4-alpha-glucan branching protein GlgB [Megalodesulfovibrio gigas]|uniref:1,4-alpha-glucan branching enzyme GlgB n=1 Tax=Megalodesulfovibrio gigas (strain ATCC 19364 / DSM 1382 / NCIMB 9332 / VKM B-1759) TaxID=1121448 RepID=T2GCQ2_MEGG1|nr:1,4-alpha-glucan branching protein GlgB [Megalodesulfovibrio gigas]AGW14058.1 putative glycogen branching protein [Megalodesulfovibrio gigas DSM 1382 = ATCC 19364]